MLVIIEISVRESKRKLNSFQILQTNSSVTLTELRSFFIAFLQTFKIVKLPCLGNKLLIYEMEKYQLFLLFSVLPIDLSLLVSNRSFL